ncbi:hypothetical protein GRF29_19g1743492 [Pseudopithomyces chartarum]|uniref:Uncharacterized protein n=1 Tax=Pseudopithomyces chartarum TaxID=1892770 RepID=A0AAN6M345_9PLEO|nr:hypothetical protein GRF29_19g1743492 [Pseudopithomyces chartarum]
MAMNEKKIAYNNKSNIDAEKAEGNSSDSPVLISYTFWDRFIERLLHPASALSLCLLSFGSLFLGLHILWIAAWYADYSTLVPLAFIYNKATPLPDETNYNFNVKGLSIIMGTGGAGIIAGLSAVAFAYLAYIVPREKLLGYPLPLASFMKHMCNFTTIQIVFGLMLMLYLTFFYEVEPARASGCYTYTNSKGKLVAKCSFESAACYTRDWPDDVERGNADQLCSEMRLLRHMAIAIVACAIALLLIYRHFETLQWRYTTPQQRLQLAEEEREEAERRKKVETEEDQKKKWYLRARTWTIISVICTVWNLTQLFHED